VSAGQLPLNRHVGDYFRKSRLVGLAVTYAIRFTERGRRLLQASHFAHSSPEEMKRYYFDVLNTGESLGVTMPHLSSLRGKIERHRANEGAKTGGTAHQSWIEIPMFFDFSP
jgi:hypothetical protein